MCLRVLAGLVGAVSILTQPEGWVPSITLSQYKSEHPFQSSPNPKVGCHNDNSTLGWQPMLVSILTQPEGWVP